MHCVECGGALESILERLRKVCSVCFFGHRFQGERRPADILLHSPPGEWDDRESGAGRGRCQAEAGPEPALSRDLAGRDGRGHDARSIVPPMPRSGPANDPEMVEVVKDLAGQVRGQGDWLEARAPITSGVIARAERAVARARSAHQRSAALLHRLEATWGVGVGRAREPVADPRRRAAGVGRFEVGTATQAGRSWGIRPKTSVIRGSTYVQST
jgi:hypothetical protein